MSRLLRVGYVVEGETDYLVIDALTEMFLKPKDYLPIRIQPPTSEYANDLGPLGGGWRGVLKWCEQARQSVAFRNYDVLIIHLDADVAQENDLVRFSLNADCPPAKTACDNLRAHILQVLNAESDIPIVICTPAQCTEAWVFATLYYEDAERYADYECRREVERLLIPKPEKLVRDKDGRAQKRVTNYKQNLGTIVRGWKNATHLCTEASRFEEELRTALSKT